MRLVNPFGETLQPANQSNLDGKRKIEFLSIQYLRAVAALGVVLVHASTSLLPHEATLLPLNIGNAGVDLFFVISGFLMFYTTAHKKLSTLDFYVKRMIRVVPMYFLATSLAFALAKFLPRFTRTFSARSYDYLRSILFIPYFNTIGETTKVVHRLIRPEVGQGWTLNYEVFFYLVFGLCLGISARSRAWVLLGWAICMVGFGLLDHPTSAPGIIYTDTLLLEFIAGVFIAFLILRNSDRIRPWMGVMMVVAGVGMVAAERFRYTPGLRFAMFGVPAALIVGGALCIELEWRMPKLSFLLLLGNASYSLYLFHIFVLAILRRLWQHQFDVNLVETHVSFVVVGVILTEITGTLIYLLLERHITHFLNDIFEKKKRARRSDTQQIYT